MRLSWKLGRVAGIDLFLHPSALLIFFLVSGAMPSGLETLAFVVALFASIVLHELGHSLMARRYGIETADITLYLFGGVARLQRMPRSAGPELLIALAGPAVNFAIAAVLFAMMNLASVAVEPSMFLGQVLLTNLILAAFNLLPIFPMDGGRILRALLSGWMGRLRATEVAAAIGRVVAVVGGIVFLLNGAWQLAILALFVYVAAGMELRQVRAEGRSPGVPEGFSDAAAAPVGYRWANRGDGVWRLVPIMVPVGGQDRSWS
jgi:Zn-dependent protease